MSPKERERNIVNLAELLPPYVRPDFEYGRIEIERKYYYLSGRIPLEVRAPDWRERKKTASAIASSRNEAIRLLAPLAKIVGSMPPRRLPFVLIFADKEPTSPQVGIATRVELDSFERKFSLSDGRFLADALRNTISLSDKGGTSEKIHETEKLVRGAVEGEYNLLCLFALGGFFALSLRREEEIVVSPQEGLLVPPPLRRRSRAFSDQETLRHVTELISLYFLLRVKQLGEGRVRVLTPAQWIALINYRDFLSLRKFSAGLPGEDKGYWVLSHPQPLERIYETRERGEKTQLAIKIPPFGISEVRMREESASTGGAQPHKKWASYKR